MYSGNHTTPNYTQSQGYYEGGVESDIEKSIVDSLDLDDKQSSSIFSSENAYLQYWDLFSAYSIGCRLNFQFNHITTQY